LYVSTGWTITNAAIDIKFLGHTGEEFFLKTVQSTTQGQMKQGTAQYQRETNFANNRWLFVTKARTRTMTKTVHSAHTRHAPEATKTGHSKKRTAHALMLLLKSTGPA
jgi:hypothetical protein